MLTVTTSQRDSLESAFQRVCVCVHIEASTELYWTTWSSPVVYSGETYTPKSMQVSDVVFDAPKSSSASFSVFDLDGTIRTAYYTEQFSQFDVNLYQLHLQDDGTWLATQSVTWKCSNCRTKRDGLFTVNLTSAGGLRQRAGLITGSRDLFPFAPLPGSKIRIGATGITVPAGFRGPPPAPGGHEQSDSPITMQTGGSGMTQPSGPVDTPMQDTQEEM